VVLCGFGFGVVYLFICNFNSYYFMLDNLGFGGYRFAWSHIFISIWDHVVGVDRVRFLVIWGLEYY